MSKFVSCSDCECTENTWYLWDKCYYGIPCKRITIKPVGRFCGLCLIKRLYDITGDALLRPTNVKRNDSFDLHSLLDEFAKTPPTRPEDVTVERDGKSYGWEEIKSM